MKLILYFKDSLIIHDIIEDIKEIKGDSFVGTDKELGGVDLTVVDYIVTDYEDDLQVGDTLPEGLADYSQDYIVISTEEQLGNLLLESAKDKVIISQIEDTVGALLMEVALLKGGAA
ncbi:hypothetical protein E0485_23005 [Paenibacillus albiflavus]|uniref:Uncharacterized protein n=1 Tax=Paenibacillus albiflavus TaxID=2545760 RepID=A0A4R4DYU6_9BACL|nr:hypothetical protein [Paenibacillus albiflavus]TCZ70959.1 hypothetical protein E0485_23005 [Paenibacillus albiflavus]